MTRFSDHFKINKPQSELDFVDIPLHTDIPLYIDAYALSIGGTDWFTECNQMVIDYFDLLIKSINSKDTAITTQLLGNLKEPNETHFGVSLDDPDGRAVGPHLAKKIEQALSKGRAVQKNLITEISDCELMIPRVGPDTISDIITNIIKLKLIEYTQDQCHQYNITLQRVPVTVWHHDERKIKSGFYQLPTYNKKPILLVPVMAARYYCTYDHGIYYKDFCLDYLKGEHWKAQDSLVRTFKDGSPRDVPKSWLKEEYPLNNKEFLVDFSDKHKTILEDYKKEAKLQQTDLTLDQIELAHREGNNINLNKLSKRLNKLESGNKDAAEYEKTIELILIGLFGDQLRNPKSQHKTLGGRHRIDITFENPISGKGFFSELYHRRKIPSPFIAFECKNYSSDISNEEFSQTESRLIDPIGKFAIIICRHIKNLDLVNQKCKDLYNKHLDRKHILVFQDSDIQELIRLRGLQNSFDTGQISRFLNEKLDEIILN